MEKSEVLVDACFLQHLSAEGKKVENFRLILNEIGFKPVIHPYVAKHELEMFPYVQQLCAEGYIRVAEWDEFLTSDGDKVYYEEIFLTIYEELRKYLDSLARRKQIPKLVLRDGEDIYTKRISGSSMGDVHMVLMAICTKIPVILSDDKDIDVLRSIARRKISFGSYSLEIFNIIDILIQIAENGDCQIDKKTLERILKESGLWSRRGEVFESILPRKNEVDGRARDNSDAK